MAGDYRIRVSWRPTESKEHFISINRDLLLEEEYLNDTPELLTYLHLSSRVMNPMNYMCQ